VHDRFVDDHDVPFGHGSGLHGQPETPDLIHASARRLAGGLDIEGHVQRGR
jgi:hypothetical protein